MFNGNGQIICSACHGLMVFEVMETTLKERKLYTFKCVKCENVKEFENVSIVPNVGTTQEEDRVC